jgi:zinc protease
VPLPAVALTFLIPPKSDPDADALRVAETILGNGESSRLYQSLVYTQQVAAEIFARADLRQQTGIFIVGSIVAGDKTAAQVEGALRGEIKKMQEAPVSNTELEKAINQLVANQLRERETNSGKAFAVAEAVVMMNDANRVNTDIARLQSVTAADIQRVMKKYFSDNNRVVITYTNEGGAK